MASTKKKGKSKKAKGKSHKGRSALSISALASYQDMRGIRVGFPANRTVDLNYTTLASVSTTSGIMAIYQWRANSAYDPDYTSTGYQPLGFDQWATYYNHYVVERLDYEVQANPVSAYPMLYGLYVSDDATIPSNPTDLTNLGGSTRISAHYSTPPVLKGTIVMKQFFNRSGDIANDTKLSAAVTADPTEQVFLSFYAQPLDETSTITMKALVRLRFRVRFMEPKDLGPSYATSTSAAAGAAPSKAPARAPPYAGPDTDDEDEYTYVRVKKQS